MVYLAIKSFMHTRGCWTTDNLWYTFNPNWQVINFIVMVIRGENLAAAITTSKQKVNL